MLTVVASIEVKPGKRAEFLEVFKANVPNVLAETGCVEYAPTVDFPTGVPIQQLDEHVVTIIEKWQSMAALTAHMATPHMLAYRKNSKDLVVKTTIKVLQQA